MTRIGDSSDDQRIQEMIEADHRQKVDQQKRADQERIGKSFQEVMAQRSGSEKSQKMASQSQAERDAASRKKDPQEATKKQVVLGNPRSQELQKRAQLATQQQGQLNKVRSELAESSRSLETDRAIDLVTRADDDRERIKKDKDIDRAADRGVEEHLAAKNEVPIGVDEDAADPGRGQRQKGSQGEEGPDKGQQPAIAVARAEGPKGALPTKIPQEILEHIAKSVAIAIAADGRTEISVSLKGTMLEGVTLHVTAKKGKVRCVFEGCDRQLANLIESSKGELMRQLGKRGLELDILRAK